MSLKEKIKEYKEKLSKNAQEKKEKKKDRQSIKRVFQNNFYMLGFVWRKSPLLVIGIFLVNASSGLISFFFNSYLFKYALNTLDEGKPVAYVLRYIIILTAVALINLLLNRIYWYYNELQYPRIERDVNREIQRKAAATDVACFEDPKFYDSYVKATAEASERAFNVMYSFSNTIWGIVNITANYAMFLSIDPLFLIMALLPFPLTFLMGKKRVAIKYKYDNESNEARRQNNYVRRVFYMKDYSKEMKLSGIHKVMRARLSKGTQDLKDVANKYGWPLALLRYFRENVILDVLLYAVSIIVAAYRLLISKTMLLGDCYVVINSITNVAANVDWVGGIYNELESQSKYIENFRKFIDHEITIKENEEGIAADRHQLLEIKDLSFRYDGSDKDVLKNISLSVKRGEKIAIVGHNGAGKTTLIKLLLRFYDPTEGEIALNGENIKEYRLSAYRDLYGTVFQDYKLFSASVAENVLLKANVSDKEKEKVRESLSNAGIGDRVAELEKGVDTIVTKEFDKEGVVFSGGEAQKISIARVFAKDPEIVILDEPTSALDPIAESEMYNNMFRAAEGKAVIFISHRLSSATQADRVYLFENGEIIEEGTHKELLALKGKYHEMWHKQADTYILDKEKEVG